MAASLGRGIAEQALHLPQQPSEEPGMEANPVVPEEPPLTMQSAAVQEDAAKPAATPEAKAPGPRQLEAVLGLPVYSFAVPQSVYGIATFMPVLHSTSTWAEWFEWVGMSTFWTAGNFALQCVMLYGVRHMAVSQFRDNDEQNTCAELDPMLVLPSLWVFAVVLLSEMAETVDLAEIVFRQVATLPKTSMLEFAPATGGDSSLEIVGGGFSLRRKVAYGLFVILPKGVMALVLLLYGSAFLVISPSHAELILNTTALIFILELDETLHALFTPAKVFRIMEAIPPITCGADLAFWSNWRPVSAFCKLALSLAIAGGVFTSAPHCGYRGHFDVTGHH